MFIPVAADSASDGRYRMIDVRANWKSTHWALPSSRTGVLNRFSRYSYGVVTSSRR